MNINFINNLKNIISVNKTQNTGNNNNVNTQYSNKNNNHQEYEENKLCSVSFQEQKTENKANIFDFFKDIMEGIGNFFKSIFNSKPDNKKYEGLPDDAQDVISKFSDNMDKMPDEVPNTLSKVSDMFKNHSTRKETLPNGEGTNECVETFDENGVQTGGYGVLKYKTGDIEVHYDDFKNGKPVSGRGVVVDPNDKIVTHYTWELDSNNKEVVKEKHFDYEGNEIKE